MTLPGSDGVSYLGQTTNAIYGMIVEKKPNHFYPEAIKNLALDQAEKSYAYLNIVFLMDIPDYSTTYATAEEISRKYNVEFNGIIAFALAQSVRNSLSFTVEIFQASEIIDETLKTLKIPKRMVTCQMTRAPPPAKEKPVPEGLIS